MALLCNILIGLIALAHVWFMVLEMWLWRLPLGRKLLNMTPEVAETTAVLASNQGVYNGFLAAGLFWSLVASTPAEAWHLKLFFLSCVLIAGIYGGLSAARLILLIQALPAAIALVLLFAAGH